MKVIYFLSDYKIGLSNLLLEQAINFKQLKDIEFTYISGEGEQISGLNKKAKYNNIFINRINGLDFHKVFYSLTKEFHNLIKLIKPEYVHVQNNWQLAIVTFVKYFFLKKFKIIYTIHAYRHNYPIRSFITRIIISLALLFIVNKVVVASSFIKRKFNLLNYKTYIIYLGVENSFFEKIHTVINSHDINIVFAGQFREGKNQKLIIRSFKNATELNNANLKLYLAGDGPLLNSCKKLAFELGLEKQVIFTGNLNRAEVLNLYQKCNIAIVATNIETFGHCIAEPYVLGLCTISRRTGIAEDIIANGVNGFLFDNDKELLTLLPEIIKSKEKIIKTGETAFANRDELRWSNIVEKYNAVYS